MQAKQNGEIIVWGTGQEERDLLYVDDLTNFIKTAIDKQETMFELVNIGLGKSISVSDLVKKIIKVSRKDLTINYNADKPSIMTKVALDCTKAKERLGWEPKTTLEQGIKKTIQWYKENID
jgi:nucleoside-diphosphate-sugar epimerase